MPLINYRGFLAPVVKEYEGFFVVCDHLIPGGTKARVLPQMMLTAKEYVYASPVQGYAQVALAYTCRRYGKRATIFTARRGQRHPRTQEAADAGASIHEIGPAGYLSVIKKRAKDYCDAGGACLLPWGLDTPEFIAGLASVVAETGIPTGSGSWPEPPKEVWSVAGSGVLQRALQQAWPDAKFYAIQVGAEPNAGKAEVIKSPEKFDNPAKEPPPFPSCANYDAKAWRFVRQYASPGALFWNVAA